MKNKIVPYIIALVAGGLATFASFIIWNSFPKTAAVPVVLIVGALYFFLGLMLGMWKVEKIWLGWLALHFIALITFIPGMIQLALIKNAEGAGSLLWFMVALLSVPMVFSIAGIWLGKKYFGKEQPPGSAPTWADKFRSGMVGFASILFPVVMGLVGMFGVMFVAFTIYSAKLPTTLHYVIYPFIFAALAAFMGFMRNKWLLDSLLVCLVPIAIWLQRVFKGPKDFNFWDFSNEPFLSMLANIALILLVILTGYLVHHWRSKHTALMPHL